MSSIRLTVILAPSDALAPRASVVTALAAQSGAEAEVITGPPGRAASDAWNAGAASARGDFLLFLRDDIEPAASLLGDHRRVHTERGDVTAIGAVLAESQRGGLPAYVARHGDDDLTRLFAEREDLPLQRVCGVPLSVSRTRFAAVGGFGAGLDWGAEAELALRLLAEGASVVTVPGAPSRRRLGTGAELLAAADAAGRASVELYRRSPAIIRHLALGAFGAGTARARVLRRMLLAARCPPVALAAAGALVPRRLCEAGWYRFVLAYAYWRGVWRAVPDRETRRRLAHAPVVLTYHAIGGVGERGSNLVVPSRTFARQLDWIRWTGARIVGLEELLRYRREHRLPPARAVAITFDDGYDDNHRLALPALRRRGLRATFFVVTDAIGGRNTWDASGDLVGRPTMSESALLEMRNGGMELGAHTLSHPTLPELSPDAAAAEIAGSRRALTRVLGAAPSAFAYPYGRYDAASRRAVAQAGFDAACCTRPGVNDPAVPDDLLRRITVRGTERPWSVAWSVWRGRGRPRG